MSRLLVYTDGACSKGNGGWAWVAVWPDGGGVASASGAELSTTNNRMELRAVIEALKALRPARRFEIVTDSAYVSNCFFERWYDTWRANGWRSSKKKPVDNQDLWEELLALVEARDVIWTHVRGHGKRASDPAHHVEGNALADQLAVEARLSLVEVL